jgi:hypothetical protein
MCLKIELPQNRPRAHRQPRPRPCRKFKDEADDEAEPDIQTDCSTTLLRRQHLDLVEFL